MPNTITPRSQVISTRFLIYRNIIGEKIKYQIIVCCICKFQLDKTPIYTKLQKHKRNNYWQMRSLMRLKMNFYDGKSIEEKEKEWLIWNTLSNVQGFLKNCCETNHDCISGGWYKLWHSDSHVRKEGNHDTKMMTAWVMHPK